MQSSAGGVEAGGNHAAVVEDQKVAGTQKIRQVAKKIVLEGSASSVEDEHAAGAANLRWGLGYQLFGKVEIEVGYAQFRSILHGKSW